VIYISLENAVAYLIHHRKPHTGVAFIALGAVGKHERAAIAISFVAAKNHSGDYFILLPQQKLPYFC
jgi:hypothetical protein